MVREKILNSIYEIINQYPQYTVSDFSVEQRKSTARGVKTVLEIKYLYASEYYIKFLLPEQKTEFSDKNLFGKDERTLDYRIECESCPGELDLSEKGYTRGLKGIIAEVRSWLNIIWEELLSIPANRELNKLRESVISLHERMNNMPDFSFSKEEQAEFEFRLDELEKRFQENYAAQHMEKEELEKKLAVLHKEIASLKETLSIFNKPTWFKSLASKGLSWAARPENQKMLKDGSSIVQGFLN